MFCLVKELFCFSRNCQTWFHDTPFTVLFTDVCILFSYFCFCLTLLYKETRHRHNTNPSLFIQVAKVQQNKWKREPAESECGRQIFNWLSYFTASFETILPFDFCIDLNILTCCSVTKRFSNNHKKYSSYLYILIVHRVFPIKIT